MGGSGGIVKPKVSAVVTIVDISGSKNGMVEVVVSVGFGSIETTTVVDRSTISFFSTSGISAEISCCL